MGYQEDRFSAVAHEIDRVALDQELGLEIERRKRFVEKEDVRGSFARVRASATRWRMPPERVEG